MNTPINIQSELIRALEAGKCPCWVHNAGITTDIEALRKIALFHADWNNEIRIKVLEMVKRENTVDQPSDLLQIVKDLLEWEAMQGGFDAPCWQRARAAVHPEPPPPEPDPGEYIRSCPSCGEIEGMGGSIYLEPGGDARCDCCGLIWGSV